MSTQLTRLSIVLLFFCFGDAKIINRCGFERTSNCTGQWSKLDDYSSSWSIQNAMTILDMPLSDVTLENSLGRFAYFKRAGRRNIPNTRTRSTTSTMVGPEFTFVGEKMCASFWYYMFDTQVPELQVNAIIKNGTHSKFLWSKEGSQGSGWHQAFLSLSGIDKGDIVQLSFTARARSPGSLAFDEVIVTDGPCPTNSVLCDFENKDLCGYRESPDHGHWKIAVASVKTGLWYDHTMGQAWLTGTYLYFDTDTKHGNEAPEIISPVYKPTEGRCLKFYYHIKHKNYSSQTGVGQLRVYRKLQSGDRFMYAQLSNSSPREGWISVRENIASTSPFSIVFQGSGNSTYIYLDDIQFSRFECKDSYGCNFESGMCSWRNRNYRAKWQITRGRDLPSGPARDVTLNDPWGHYIYTVTQYPFQRGYKAILESQEMNMGLCMTFYSAPIGSGYSPLVVDLYTKENPKPVTLKLLRPRETGTVIGRWVKNYIDLEQAIPKTNPNVDMWFRLTTEFTNVTGSGWAVDQIEISSKRCSELEEDDTSMVSCRTDATDQIKEIPRSKECNFMPDCPRGSDEEQCGPCTFGSDVGWCRWMDTSFSEIEWTTSRNVDPDLIKDVLARPKDSKGKANGDFLLVHKATYPHEGSMLAEMETEFKFGPSPATCQIQFAFYRTTESDDTHKDPLTVVIRQRGEETVIFKDSFITSDWTNVTLDIGGIESPFKVAFLGYKNETKKSDGIIAIDDIQMLHCVFPTTRWCHVKKFRCNRDACVWPNEVCDFTDDCGDGSDETQAQCESHNVILRTNFEQGFGDWSVPGFANTAKTWKIEEGVVGQTKPNNPGRDHTLGTLHGHYAILESNDQGQIVSPVVSAVDMNDYPGCTLRFYYYINTKGEDDRSLTVSTRTLDGQSILQFHRFTDHDQEWQDGYVRLANMTKPFQIIFAGEGRAVVALDDISLMGCKLADANFSGGAIPTIPTPQCTPDQFKCLDGLACIEKAEKCNLHSDCDDGSDEINCDSCDFEHGLCDWRDGSSSPFSWKLRASNAITGPTKDATLQENDQGHFMKLQLHSTGASREPALLYSPLMAVTDPACQFLFSYYTNIPFSKESLVVGLQLNSTVAPNDLIELNRTSSFPIQTRKWTRLSYNIGRLDSAGARIVLKRRFEKLDKYSSIAIDDVAFENCRVDAIPAILSNISALECPFSSSFCEYHPTHTGASRDVQWHFAKSTDHKGRKTIVAKTGSRFLPDNKFKGVAKLTSNWIKPTDTPLCLYFWYWNFGSTLTIRSIPNQASEPIFSDRSMEFKWRSGLAEIPPSTDKFRIEFESQTRQGLQLSDVTVKNGQCPPQDVCDFERSNCGYKTELDNTWLRTDGGISNVSTDITVDHTTNTKYGHFMFVAGDSGSITEMISSSFIQLTNTETCLYFWYMLHGQDVGSLKVGPRNNTLAFLMSLSATPADVDGLHWRQARMTIPGDIGEYELVFAAVPNAGGSLGTIAVDDVFIDVRGACPSPGSCKFDDGMCGYTVYNDVDDPARWMRGPDSKGEDVYAHHRGKDDRSVMASPLLPPTNGGSVSVFLKLNIASDAVLNVYIGDTRYLSISTKPSRHWRNYKFNYTSETSHHLIFEMIGVGEVSLDDIKVTSGDNTVPYIPVEREHCSTYCKHYTSCTLLGHNKAQCKCKDGYTGDSCDVASSGKTSKITEEAASSSGLVIGLVIGIIVLVVIATVVLFIVLMRAKKLKAPKFISRYLTLKEDQTETTPTPSEQSQTPSSYSYTNTAHSEGIVNPMYGAETGESDI